MSVQPDSASEAARRGVASFTVQSAVGADVRESIAQTVVQSGWGLLELRPALLSLEEIFLQLTTTDSATGARS